MTGRGLRRSYNCTPVSMPALPSLASHALWAAWDHTLELALAQLPAMLGPSPRPYHHSPFFRDQLTAFQVWLDLGKCEYPLLMWLGEYSENIIYQYTLSKMT